MAKHRYISLLRCKRGELTGVSHLQASAKANVSPLLVLASEQYKLKKATKTKPEVPAPAVFCANLQAVWGSSAVLLDASQLTVGVAPHPIVEITAHGRAAGLSLIPVTSLNAPPGYQDAVKSLSRKDGRGVALRIDLEDMSSAADWAPSWFCPPAETDLVVDLADNASAVLSLGKTVVNAFADLHHGKRWRSVTVAGSSMPENFTGFAAGTRPIGRNEWALRRKLASGELPYRIDYGDYATVSVVGPPTGIAYGFPINVRYTLETDFLVCRGVRTRGIDAVDQDVQLIGHAKQIVAYKKRGRLECWGDRTIDAIAAGTEDPDALEKWVSIGVNRHITLVRANLP